MEAKNSVENNVSPKLKQLPHSVDSVFHMQQTHYTSAPAKKKSKPFLAQQTMFQVMKMLFKTNSLHKEHSLCSHGTPTK